MRIRMHRKSLLWIVSGLFLLATQPVWGAHYRLIPLAQEGALNGRATDLNDAGTVVGFSQFPALASGGLVYKGYVWTEAGYETLTPLAIHVAKDKNLSFTKAWGINAAGHLAGESGYSNASDGDCKAVIKTAGPLRHPAPLQAGIVSRGCGINASGEICGQSGTTAAVWQAEALTLVPLAESTQSIALGINDAGDVVGEAQMATGKRPFLKRGSVVSELPPLAGMNQGSAQDINAAGSAAGWMVLNGYQDVAVLWKGESVVALPGLGMMMGCKAFGLNTAHEVVGQSQIPGSGWPMKWGAVLWKEAESVVDLSLLVSPETRAAWHMACATAINSHGWITGYGTFNNREAGFVLKPEITQSVGGTIITMLPGYPLPVKGGTVCLEGTGLTAETGDDGRFFIADVPEGTFELVFSAEGLKSKIISVTISEADDVVISETETLLVAGLSGDVDGSARLDMTDAHRALTGSAGL